MSVLPIHHFYDNATFTKLFRIVRIPRILKIFDKSNFDMFMDSFLSIQLSKNPSGGRQERMKIKLVCKYIYRALKLFTIALFLTYFSACFWYGTVSLVDIYFPTDFITEEFTEEDSNLERLITCCYYILTTLTTVGYGDLLPSNNFEKVMAIVIMLAGIALFSFIMGNFNDVLINYDKSMGIVNKNSDLQAWLTSLSKFTGNRPLPRKLIKSIEDHFKYFWKHDRLHSLSLDDDYLNTMPSNLRYELIDYLFEDIFQLFRGFLLKKEFPDAQEFYYRLAFSLLPRKFEANQKIGSQGDEILEIILILEGELKMGFQTEEGPVFRYFGKGYFWGSYNVFFSKPLEYDCYASTTLKCYGLPKDSFLELLESERLIQERMISGSIKKNLETTKAMDKQKKSLRELMMSKGGSSPSQDQVNGYYSTCVKDRCKRIAEDREKKREDEKKSSQSEGHNALRLEVISDLRGVAKKIEKLKNYNADNFLNVSCNEHHHPI